MNKEKKNIIAIVAVLLISIIVFTGCAGNDSKDADKSSEKASVSQSKEEASVSGERQKQNPTMKSLKKNSQAKKRLMHQKKKTNPKPQPLPKIQSMVMQRFMKPKKVFLLPKPKAERKLN